MIEKEINKMAYLVIDIFLTEKLYFLKVRPINFGQTLAYQGWVMESGVICPGIMGQKLYERGTCP